MANLLALLKVLHLEEAGFSRTTHAEILRKLASRKATSVDLIWQFILPYSYGQNRPELYSEFTKDELDTIKKLMKELNVKYAGSPTEDQGKKIRSISEDYTVPRNSYQLEQARKRKEAELAKQKEIEEGKKKQARIDAGIDLTGSAKEVISKELERLNITQVDLDDVRQLVTLRNGIDKNLVKAKERLEDSNKALASIDKLAVAEDAQKVSPEYVAILVKEAESAFLKNYDLNISSWKSHLLTALQKPGMISIDAVIKTNSENNDVVVSDFTVSIVDNMKAKLGTIEEYADAVIYTRSALNYGRHLQGPEASRVWFRQLWQVARAGGGVITRKVRDKKRDVYEQVGYIDKKGRYREVPALKKIYYRELERDSKGFLKEAGRVNEDREAKLTEFYWDIMRTRLEYMSDRAPYWNLLNYGSVSLKDTGKSGTGYAAPMLVPTNFVERAEQEIKKAVWNKYTSEVNEVRTSSLVGTIENLTKIIDNASKLLAVIDNLLDNVQGGYEKRVDIIVTKMNSALSEILGIVKDDAALMARVSSKMAVLTNKIIADENVGERLYLFSIGKKQYRKRTSDIVRQIYEEFQKQNVASTSPAAIEKAKAVLADLLEKSKKKPQGKIIK